jgi:pimeloyl-ACP methyl ester carboxylesterase
MNVPRIPASFLALLTLVLAACAAPGDATKPLPVRIVAASCGRPVDTLLVLLPGAGDRGDDFIDEGFVDAVRSHGVAADIALVGATVAYYRAGNVVQRLADEVVAPARARGIRHVWLAGVSLGGLGSLIYANERRGETDGLLLVAPYLGERAIVAEVGDAGGIARWSPPAVVPQEDRDRRLWQWLRTLTARREPGLPPVWLGFGVDDRFVAGHRLLAAALPADHVFTAPGGHDWPAWRRVWNAMLDAAPLPHDPTCEPS